MAKRKTRTVAITAALSTLALVASACGFRDDDVTTDVGVTKEACPNAVNQDNGCIKLGIITDLTGPFSPLAIPVTDGQKAFWKKVNQDGGIGGYDIDVSNVKDNKYNPETHKQVFDEIKGDVLALAQTLGSPQTAAIISELKSKKIVSAPASWSSEWAFEDVVLQSGANYCVEAMNSIDYAVEEFGAKSVMAVHYPGDYGGDAAAGAKKAAEANKLKFDDVETTPGQDNQGAAVQAVVSKKPDVVILTTAPTEAAVIVGQSAAGGFTGKFIGTSPTWNPALLKSPAAKAFQALYLQSGPWEPFGGDTEGHKAMREAIGDVTPNDGYIAGWTWQYPMKAALEKAIEAGDVTRAGLYEAAKSLESVDYQGILPEGAGNYKASPNDGLVRQNVISKVDEKAPTGVAVVKEFFTGPTAEKFDFTEKCFE